MKSSAYNQSSMFLEIDAVFFNYSSVGEYKKSIGKRLDAILALINILWDIIVKGKRDATTALFNLSVFY